MKKKLSVLFIAILMANVFYTKAQETINEGKLTMVVSLPEADAHVAAAMKSMLDGEVMYFKNGSTRMEMKNSMGSVITIFNKQKRATYTMMDMFGTKYAMKIDSAQIDSLKKTIVKTDSTKKDFFAANHPDVKLTSDTKKILGYNCKKAILTYMVDGNKRDFDCWYTNEIAATNSKAANSEIKGIDGFVVDMTTVYNMAGKEMVLSMKVTSIEKIAVSDTMFELSAAYPLKSMNDLKEQFKSKPVQPQGTSLVSPPGTIFPEIKMTGVNGDTIKLSSLRGKYVLVDFWASWCAPCRAENPNVVAAYKKYKDKGFTVYSVSLDSDKTKWQKAIEKDKLIWPSHVCDYMGWMSPVCRQFNINGIPFNYLLDKEGKVLAVGLRGDELEKKLNEIFK